LGALSAAWIADRTGRRVALFFIFVVRLASTTFEYVATTHPIFFAGRFLGGFSTGATSTLSMTYIGEISPLPLRGVLTAAAPIALIFGSMSAAIMVTLTGTQTSRWAYRTAFVSSFGFAGIAVFILPFMPESPWWLINHGREGDAIHTLQRLGYTSDDVEEQVAAIKRIQSKTKAETQGATYAECFRRSNLRRTMISALPLIIQTFSGVAFVGSYSTYYQQLAGYSTAASFHLFIVQQILSGSGNVCSWFLVDRVGRRNLTFCGMVVLTVILLITGGVFSHHLFLELLLKQLLISECSGLAVSGTPGAIKGTIALLQLFCFVYNATIGATAFTILTEISTSRLRAKTASISVALQSGFFVSSSLFSFLPRSPKPHSWLGLVDADHQPHTDHVELPSAISLQPRQGESRSQGHLHLRVLLRPVHCVSLVLSTGIRASVIRATGRVVHQTCSPSQVQNLLRDRRSRQEG
jgi:MFS family permease